MLRAALAYAELGYHVFPLVVGTKKPATIHGLHDATTSSEQIEAWWRANPQANVAIRTDGLLVVDVDGAENPWLTENEERQSSLSGCPIQRTPRGGLHFVFRQPAGKNWRNTASRLAPNVDTRGAGGYIAVAPSRVDSGSYSWVTEHELVDPPELLPEPPDWLAEALDAVRSGRFNLERNGSDPTIAPGARNSTLTQIAGSMRRFGHTPNMIKAALDVANREVCSDPLPEPEVDRIAGSIGRLDPDQLSTAIVYGIEPPADDENPGDPGAFPSELLQVPGLLGRYLEHERLVAHREQPVLALASSLALLSVLTGRKLTDRSGSHTNLYVLGVCRSGGGKENARALNKQLLADAGLDQLIGSEGFASSAGIVAAIEARPAQLFQVDEIGRLLATAADPRSPHLYNILTVLMKLFTSAGKVFATDAYADSKKNKVIRWPHAVLYGTTVPESFFGSLTTESISDGFLSRLLVFEGAEHLPPLSNRDYAAPPEDLVAEVKAWGELETGGNLSALNPAPRVLSHTVEAQDVLEAYIRSCETAQAGASHPYDTLWGRAVEKARKLALLHAASRGGVEIEAIEAADVRWGTEVATYLTQRLAHLARERISDGAYDRLAKRVLRHVRTSGQKGLSKTALARKLSDVRARERDEVIADQIRLGKMAQELRDTGGRPVCTYRLTTFLHNSGSGENDRET